MVLLIHTHIVLMDFWSGLGISWDILWNILESHVWKKMQLRKVFFWLYAFWLPFLAEGICPGMTSTLDDLRLMKHPFAREVWIIFSYIISYIFSYIMTYIYIHIFIIHTYMGIHMYTYCAYIYISHSSMWYPMRSNILHGSDGWADEVWVSLGHLLRASSNCVH